MNQTTERTLILIVLILFGILTAVAIWTEGIVGIFATAVRSWGSLQIFIDLAIALTLILVWMYRDMKAKGRNPWPWVIATLAVGAFAPLVYLLVRDTTNGQA